MYRLAPLALAFAMAPAFGADCSTTIDSNDAMRFDRDLIEISAQCEQFTLTLTHSGSLPVAAMGHNWVLAEESDIPAVAADAVAAGASAGYLAADDERVIAHTRMLGGGETDSVTFDVALLDADGEYGFFCSFPGHSALMRGRVVLVD